MAVAICWKVCISARSQLTVLKKARHRGILIVQELFSTSHAGVLGVMWVCKAIASLGTSVDWDLKALEFERFGAIQPGSQQSIMFQEQICLAYVLFICRCAAATLNVVAML
jgi:hypothetical protein